MRTNWEQTALPAPEKENKPRKRRNGLLWLLLLLLPGICWWTTQIDVVPVSSRNYTVLNTVQWEDDIILCEYQSRYRSTFTHDYVLCDGAVYFPAKRPVLDKQRLREGYHGAWKLNPDAVLDLQTRTYVPVDAIYLGNPEYPEDTVLIWARGMALPTPSEEKRTEAESWDWIIF